MKAFATISALLGITYANPIQHIQYGSTGLINQHSSNNMLTNKDMHPMSTQFMAQKMAKMPQPVVNPNQYLMKDNFGNYAFGYSTQNSEMAEKGNAQSKKGHFANIMADGKLRRVDYVADNQGFHILRDTADNTGRYIKREAEAEPTVQPDLIRTRMTSYMDSNSLRDDGNDLRKTSSNMLGRDMTSFNIEPKMDHMSTMHRSSDMMNQGMSSNIMNQGMSSDMMSQGMSSNIMGLDMTSNRLGHDRLTQMMGPDRSGNRMGHESTSSIMGRDRLTNINMRNQNMDIPMMRQNMYTNMMGSRDMTSTPTLMMGQDLSSDMMERSIIGQDMYSNVMDNHNKIMSSNIMMGSNMNQMTPLNRMSQRMQIETMPSQSMNRFF